jgi:hypothetical protein
MLVGFFYDPSKPNERDMIRANMAFYATETTGVNEPALTHILATTSGKNIVGAAAQHFAPGQRFNRADLARVLTTDDAPVDDAKVFAWIRQLGRPESRFGVSILQRHGDGTYSLAERMHAAILRILAGEES